MIEHITKPLEVFSLTEKNNIGPAVEAVMAGKITLLRVGSVFSFVLNPNIPNLIEKFNLLKERQSTQLMSAVCTYAQAKQIVDKNRVNQDFFRLSEHFCSNVIVRIPIDTTLSVPIPYNAKDGTMQFLSFEDASPVRKAFGQALALKGCGYTAITSGNIHGAPTIEDLQSAKMLATLLNIKASFLEINEVETVVSEIPQDKGPHKGSFIILSFCNPRAIEVKRLANKSDREVTDRYLKELFAKVNTQTPLEYVL